MPLLQVLLHILFTYNKWTLFTLFVASLVNKELVGSKGRGSWQFQATSLTLIVHWDLGIKLMFSCVDLKPLLVCQIINLKRKIEQLTTDVYKKNSYS